MAVRIVLVPTGEALVIARAAPRAPRAGGSASAASARARPGGAGRGGLRSLRSGGPVATEYYAPDLDRALIVPIRQLRRQAAPEPALGPGASAPVASWVLVTDYYLRDRAAFRDWVLARCRLTEDFHREGARFRDGYYRSRQQAVNLWRCPPTEVVRAEEDDEEE